MSKLVSTVELQNTLFSLSKYNENITSGSDIIKIKDRFNIDIKKILLLLKDLKMMLPNKDFINDDLTYMQNNLDVINDMEDAIIIKSIISTIIDGFDASHYDYYDKYDVGAYSRKHADEDYFANKLKEEDMVLLNDLIKYNRNINVLDPLCFRGNNINSFKSNNTNMKTYGIEQTNNSLTFTDAKTNIDKVILGKLEGSRISNDVFDIVFLSPLIQIEAAYSETLYLKEKKEKSLIRSCFKYIRPGGLYIINIPYTRITPDIALLLSKQLDDVTVIKATKTSLKDVIIIGKRRFTKDAKPDIYSLLGNINYDELNDIAYYISQNKEYELPNGTLDVNFFRGSILDENELLSITQTSGVYKDFWNAQSNTKEDEDTSPLLPFNLGQIGLVLTSGCLDGIIQETGDICHAIKGMTTKVKYTENTNNENNTKQSSVETISNRVQINILTASGEFIELA